MDGCDCADDDDDDDDARDAWVRMHHMMMM